MEFQTIFYKQLILIIITPKFIRNINTKNENNNNNNNKLIYNNRGGVGPIRKKMERYPEHKRP